MSSFSSFAPTAALAPVVLRDVGVTFPDREVLAGVDLVAQRGRRVALIGDNGVGKSTLLRAVAGRLPVRARVHGSIERPGDTVLLGQEPPFADEHTVGQVLDAHLVGVGMAVLVHGQLRQQGGARSGRRGDRRAAGRDEEAGQGECTRDHGPTPWTDRRRL